MLWFFDRRGQHLSLETRYDSAVSQYVLLVHWPDGHEDTERFMDLDAYRQRLVALEQQLGRDQWIRHGPPIFVPDGWPDRGFL